ncbi:ATP-binding cassette domain-containing protein [Bradyrhizobium archetypum]|uniref:ATP-binding cassette domain-containing protein n=1 Tax=Bradyrhizobium archetypum TaxID=2721160 RepID=A0A7Y4H1K6_9BRAD|nr:ATP-binding cassette domain-containing protein [Bradyrhizobium archetypum]NOJ45951.1 ATP-binding cassette domain-containing protein [Bradyrhizobium archetypum]
MTAAAHSAPLLDAAGLGKRYGGVVANDGIDIRLDKGRVLGVIGPNGAGKSTLIGLLGGAIAPSAGRIRFEGDDITALPASERARRGIGRTYQIPRPFLDMTVAENLAVGQFSLSPFISAATATAERRDILERCGLADATDVKARDLPLLRRKRLEVARALALKPKLLLLDEVGAGLIDSEVSELIALIRSLQDGERSIIIIEHVIRIVKECCEDLVVINFGKVLTKGPTAEVLASDEVSAVYLGTSHGGAANASPIAAPSTTADPAPSASATAAPLLALEGVSAGYGQARVIHDLSLSVMPGQVVGILGTNGAGKTTLAHVISRALPVTAGRIRFAGDDITALPPHAAAARGIAHCMEGRRIFASLSVEENLLVSARNVATAQCKERLERIYALFPVLAERRHAAGTSISGGQQQALAIGRALMAKPRLVIFDEISLGLAPVMMDRLYEALAELKREGLTMLVVEQDVERALDVADVAHIINKGRITLSGSAAVVRADERLRHLYFGIED